MGGTFGADREKRAEAVKQGGCRERERPHGKMGRGGWKVDGKSKEFVALTSLYREL